MRSFAKRRYNHVNIRSEHRFHSRMRCFRKIGMASMDDLFTGIPENVRLKSELKLPEAKSEI